ncbi:hypothetical protein ACFVFI_33835 [Streptomyces sp. NPDC057705]|uniref:hypothetical protein n=1 Tax=Streptomyces sp. NPDC057705 TaxID=3346222 RepID=UPI0036A6BCBE
MRRRVAACGEAHARVPTAAALTSGEANERVPTAAALATVILDQVHLVGVPHHARRSLPRLRGRVSAGRSCRSGEKRGNERNADYAKHLHTNIHSHDFVSLSDSISQVSRCTAVHLKRGSLVTGHEQSSGNSGLDRIDRRSTPPRLG